MLLLLLVCVLIVGCKFIFRNKELVLPVWVQLLMAILFFTSFTAAIYFLFFNKDDVSPAGYGAVSWLVITAALSGLVIVLFGRSTTLFTIYRTVIGLCTLLALPAAFMAASHIEDRPKNVLYQDAEFRVEKRRLWSYRLALPDVYVSKGVWEKHYYLHNAIQLEQQKITGVSIQKISSDSVVVILRHRSNRPNIPDPLLVGLRLQ